VTAGLGGTGRVADDLWLMAHHETSGKPFLQPRPLGIGVAGGLLAELMLTGHVIVGFDRAVVARPARPGDGLARLVHERIAGEPGRLPLPEWLLFLARTAAVDVALRLEGAGYLVRAGRRAWGGPRWVPTDADRAFAALLRARPAVDAARPLTAHAVVLAGLSAGCGLRFRLEQYLPPAGRTVEETVAQLPPDLQKLTGAVQAAVDGAVLTHRT
jgi:Golgi phosphoprotein 3 (GPP34)